MDWVTYCCLSNRFPKTDDPKNKICKNVNKMLIEIGEITPEASNIKRRGEKCLDFDEQDLAKLNEDVSMNIDVNRQTIQSFQLKPQQYCFDNDMAIKIEHIIRISNVVVAKCKLFNLMVSFCFHKLLSCKINFLYRNMLRLNAPSVYYFFTKMKGAFIQAFNIY